MDVDVAQVSSKVPETDGDVWTGTAVVRLEHVARRPRRVALGMFDGVHRGHRAVIADSDTVVTFDPHPCVLLRPTSAPPLLTGITGRARLLARLDVRELVVIPFDEAFSLRSPEAFIEDVLVGALDARCVSVGETFRFGRGGAGDHHMLTAETRFATRVVPIVMHQGERVSSARIRRLILEGRIEMANILLGSPLRLEGVVQQSRPDTDVIRVALDGGRIRPAPGRYVCRLGRGPLVARVPAGVGPIALTMTEDGKPPRVGCAVSIELLRRLDPEAGTAAAR